MKELLEKLTVQFEDKEFRHAYALSFMNTYIAAQIKMLREQRHLTQQALADLVGTKQSGIARLENVNYDAWKVETLAKFAEAFDVRLKITFEEYGTLPREIESFNKESLQREPYSSDPVFHPNMVELIPLSVETNKKDQDVWATTPESWNNLPFLPPQPPQPLYPTTVS
jgi:transcriptional regulator with XRE-family HTH domain